MLPKLKNQREITLTFNYNTKKVIYNFGANIEKFSKDDMQKRRKENDLAVKMLALALHNENAVWFRMTLNSVHNLMLKQNKKYFNKLEKQNKIKKLCSHK